jgi:hypothetical protein
VTEKFVKENTEELVKENIEKLVKEIIAELKKEIESRSIPSFCSDVRGYFEKKNIPYEKLLDLTAQSLMLSAILAGENKKLKDINEIHRKFSVKYEKMFKKLINVNKQLKKADNKEIEETVIYAMAYQKHLLAIKRADGRHEKNRFTKVQIINYYITNYVGKLKGLGVRDASKIKNQAAEEIASKFGLEYRTVRNSYIDSYHRNNTPS